MALQYLAGQRELHAHMYLVHVQYNLYTEKANSRRAKPFPWPGCIFKLGKLSSLHLPPLLEAADLQQGNAVAVL